MSKATYIEENGLVYNLQKAARQRRALKKEEVVTASIFARRQIEREKVRFAGLNAVYVIGKAVFTVFSQDFEAEQNSRKIKYLLTRPDLNFCEAGSFDYILGLDVRDMLLDIYYSKAFNDF